MRLKSMWGGNLPLTLILEPFNTLDSIGGSIAPEDQQLVEGFGPEQMHEPLPAAVFLEAEQSIVHHEL